MWPEGCSFSTSGKDMLLKGAQDPEATAASGENKLDVWSSRNRDLLSTVSVQFSRLSRVRLFANPRIAAHQASRSIINSRSSLRFMSIKLVMPSSHLILCCPLLLLPPIPPSITVFSNVSTLHIRWPTYWSFSFSISPSKEHPGLISFRMGWLDFLAVHGTLKSLLKQKHQFFGTQLSSQSNSHIHSWLLEKP